MKKRWKELIFAVWLISSMVAMGYIFLKNGYNLVNSDDSAELILARLLSEGNGILSRGWMYSTELRVVNTQLIRALLFRITDNWMSVRIVSSLVLDLWLLISYGFFIIQLTGERKWFWYTAPFLLVPFSGEAFYVYGAMAYYIPHLALSFQILGLCIGLWKDNRSKLLKYLLLAAVSLLAALGGIRQLLITTVPLILALFFLVLRHSELLEKKKEFCTPCLAIGWSAFWSFTGYLVNAKLLTKIYHFKAYDELHLNQPTMERLQVILRGILNVFGYTEGDVPDTLLMSEKGILLVLSLGFLVWMGLLLLLIWKNRNSLSLVSEFVYWFSIWGFLLCFLLFLFTDVEVTARYYLLYIMMFVPLLAVFYRETGLSTEVKKLLYGMAVIAVVILSFGVYRNELRKTANEERAVLKEYLVEHGYTYGYATFWNADVMTELSGGRIEMAALEEHDGNCSLFPWLVSLDTLFPREPRKDVFLILHGNERNKFSSLIENREAIFETESLYLYTYESSAEFTALLTQE